MKESMVLHIVRNPHGFTDEEIREARLACADLVEKYKDAYINMRDFAEGKGLDTTSRHYSNTTTDDV